MAHYIFRDRDRQINICAESLTINSQKNNQKNESEMLRYILLNLYCLI